MSERKIFIVPSNDAEAVAIQSLLKANGYREGNNLYITGQTWGASWDATTIVGLSKKFGGWSGGALDQGYGYWGMGGSDVAEKGITPQTLETCVQMCGAPSKHGGGGSGHWKKRHRTHGTEND